MEQLSLTREPANAATDISPRHARVLRTLSACSRAVIRATDEQSLLDEICRTMVTAGGYTHSWIGYAQDDVSKTVRPMAQVGFHDKTFGLTRVSWSDQRPEGRGVFGNAIRTGKPSLIRDALHASSMRPWRDVTEVYHYSAVLGLPLVVEGQVIGAIGFYSAEADRFDPQEIELLGEVASDLSYGISVIRMRRERDDAQAKLETMNRVLEQRVRERTAALLAEKEKATVTLQSIGDGVITTDMQGLVEYLNPVAERLTGWTNAEARGEHLREVFRIVDDFSRAPLANPVDKVIDSGGIVDLAGDAILISKSGREYAIEETAAPIRGADGRVIGVVLAFHDVSRSRQIAAQLSYQATHDEVTGLLNRRAFEAKLEQAAQSAIAQGKQHAFIYMDLDQFKVVNDTSGHGAGDELLRTLAGLLQARLRAGDTLARLGGDEFGVLLENCPPQPAANIAETLRELANDFRFVWQGNTFAVSLSIGVVDFGGGNMTVAEIFSAADTACYIAKENGRNRVHIGNRDDRDVSQRQGEMHWVGRLRQAIQDNRMQLYCQTIAPIATGDDESGVHMELLLRLCDEEGKLVPPGAFLPAAERFGVMPALDRWVIATAFANFTQLTPNPHDRLAMCAINISGASISDPHFLSFIINEMATHQVPAERVCFEITETVAIGSLTQATGFIQELRRAGCKFALDDFGSGMSSFGYLKHLPVDYLKIDGSFVKDMTTDAADAAMVEAINNIGHTLGLQTIAEFVENDAIVEMLRALRVDYAQGYGIGKPVPCRPWQVKN